VSHISLSERKSFPCAGTRGPKNRSEDGCGGGTAWKGKEGKLLPSLDREENLVRKGILLVKQKGSAAFHAQ